MGVTGGVANILIAGQENKASSLGSFGNRGIDRGGTSKHIIINLRFKAELTQTCTKSERHAPVN